MPEDKVIAVMDANCGLCARGAAWIARNDRADRFRIVPVQSVFGARLLRAEGLDPSDPASWLVIDAKGTHHGLDALIVAAGHLGGVNRALGLFRVLPAPLRRWLYGVVARNRYRVFGRADLCSLPDPAVQYRLHLADSL